jgi:hypothetical protein
LNGTNDEFQKERGSLCTGRNADAGLTLVQERGIFDRLMFKMHNSKLLVKNVILRALLSFGDRAPNNMS